MMAYCSRLGVTLVILVVFTSLAQTQKEASSTNAECDSCRTLVEQFYYGWEYTITSLAEKGTFERVPGGAPKITYNQDIEDFLQGFCDSKWMKKLSPYISDGCKSVMKSHHRSIVGKFLHEEETMGTVGRRTNRPKKIHDVCVKLTKSCPEEYVPSANLTDKKDKCGTCRGIVADAQYVLRRSWLGDLKPSALKKKRLELFELIEPLCTDIYYRYENEPDARNAICTELWEQDEEALINALVEGGDVEHKVCVQAFGVCKANDKGEL